VQGHKPGPPRGGLGEREGRRSLSGGGAVDTQDDGPVRAVFAPDDQHGALGVCGQMPGDRAEQQLRDVAVSPAPDDGQGCVARQGREHLSRVALDEFARDIRLRGGHAGPGNRLGQHLFARLGQEVMAGLVQHRPEPGRGQRPVERMHHLQRQSVDGGLPRRRIHRRKARCRIVRPDDYRAGARHDGPTLSSVRSGVIATGLRRPLSGLRCVRGA
jgi:hypothetical protein